MCFCLSSSLDEVLAQNQDGAKDVKAANDRADAAEASVQAATARAEAAEAKLKELPSFLRTLRDNFRDKIVLKGQFYRAIL